VVVVSGRRLSLAGQLLILQLVVLSVVVVCVGAVSWVQSDAAFRRDQARRTLAVAEVVAGNATVRAGLEPGHDRGSVAPAAQGVRTLSDVDRVEVADSGFTIVTSSDPLRVGRHMPLHGSTVTRGRSWSAVVQSEDGKVVLSQAPILGDDGTLLGVASVASKYPPWWRTLRDDTARLAVFLGVAAMLGLLGTLLVARRVKRQTLGLEPRDITSLVELRNAILHGVKEGVIAMDTGQRVTLVNEEAIRLLDLSPDPVGRSLGELGLPHSIVEVLTGTAPGQDVAVVASRRLLTLNRRPIAWKGKELGSVTTLRDSTELAELRTQLDSTLASTDTLRAQAHEFDNRLHTIAGLVELGEYDEVAGYVQRITSDRAQLDEDITSRVADPALAALLVAKFSRAAEQQVTLRLTDDTAVGRLPDDVAADALTVLGNLVDNALDASGQGGHVTVRMVGGDRLRVEVRDDGPGVPDELAEAIFDRGVSTKDDAGPHGFGLALTRLVCRRRGGDVVLEPTADGGEGAAFVAELPLTTVGTP
jgi:sensor histidine kinase regulating citrate/malate metabolism